MSAQKKLCAAAPPSPYKHNGTIVTSFDTATRGMRTTLTHPRIINAGGEAFYLTASFLHRKADRPAPLAVEIAFISAAKSPKHRDSHNLVFLADGRPFPLVVPAQYQTAKAERGQTLEATKVTVPFDSLLNLLRAGRVATRIGQTELELTQNHLEALRELASLIAPSPSKWATN
ncbi:MAG TPA: hypothetical protein VGB73_08930 [Pyrinomonadaceae bacterium]